jgi:preprotein translocase SecE subunit
LETSQYQKWVNLCFLAFAGLLAYLVFATGLHAVAAFDLEARVRNVDLILRGVSILMGAIVFFGLYRNDQTNQFVNEAVTELVRVSWPTHKETTNGTIIVIVMVLISGMVLGLFDYIWTHLLQMVL